MRRAKRERSDDAPQPRQRGRDEGFSIIEIIACITIMGIVMTPIMYAVISTVKTSSVTRSVAQVETVLQNAADRVNRAPKVCDYTVYAQAAVRTQGWDGSQASAVAVHYVKAVDGTWSWESGACPGTTPTDLLVQMVTITVTSPDGDITKKIEVVKSDV